VWPIIATFLKRIISPNKDANRMREANNATALLLGFLLLAIVGAKEWLLDLWRTSPGFGRWIVGITVSIVIGFAFVWAVVPIIFKW